MENPKYKIGTKVVFTPAYDSSRKGQTAVVFDHNRVTDGSIARYGIEFTDGHKIWAHVSELTSTKD